LKVLQNLDEIVGGNCTSAIGGNPNCAKFMLDWSGVSDLRSPLARPAQQGTLTGTLLKKLKNTPEKSKKRNQKAPAK
jgi:hypothetical protein